MHPLDLGFRESPRQQKLVAIPEPLFSGSLELLHEILRQHSEILRQHAEILPILTAFKITVDDGQTQKN